MPLITASSSYVESVYRELVGLGPYLRFEHMLVGMEKLSLVKAYCKRSGLLVAEGHAFHDTEFVEKLRKYVRGMLAMRPDLRVKVPTAPNEASDLADALRDAINFSR